MVLGIGRPVACVEAGDWRAKQAQETRDAIRADGAVPLLRRQYDQVQAMAAAIAAHPVASLLLGGLPGKAEQSAFWTDDATGIWCRARYDYLIDDQQSGRLLIPDYKTAQSADPGRAARAAYDFGYHIQAWWYADGALTLGLADDVAFLLVFQEKDPPYLVTICQPDQEMLRAGEARARQARERYRDCTEAGAWPGHSGDVELISLPPWARNREDHL
jgi:hypothetical protein